MYADRVMGLGQEFVNKVSAWPFFLGQSAVSDWVMLPVYWHSCAVDGSRLHHSPLDGHAIITPTDNFEKKLGIL